MRIILLLLVFQLLSQLNALAVKQNSAQDAMENDSMNSEATNGPQVETTEQMTNESEPAGQTTEETEFPSTTTHSSGVNLKYSSMSIVSIYLFKELLFRTL
jgi:hypothetical protein